MARSCLPAGTLVYEYLVPLEGGAVLRVTTDSIEGDHAEERRVLDLMMKTIDFSFSVIRPLITTQAGAQAGASPRAFGGRASARTVSDQASGQIAASISRERASGGWGLPGG